MRPTSKRHRAGFTLIEMIIVIGIVLTIAAFLFPAINSAFNSATRAQQVAEVTQLDLALQEFHNDKHTYPPSRIRLREWVNGTSDADDAYDLTTADGDAVDQVDFETVKALRQIFGKDIDLPIRTGPGSSDFTGGAEPMEWFREAGATGPTADTAYELEGDQCLVFFLGGIGEEVGDEIVLHGFTDSPTNPSGVPTATRSASLKRTTPYFDFDPGRLYLRSEETNGVVTGSMLSAEYTSGSGNRFTLIGEEGAGGLGTNRTQAELLAGLGLLPSYAAIGTEDDDRPAPIVYFSSYNGQGYRPADVMLPDPTGVLESAPFQNRTTPDEFAYPSGPNPYTLGDPNPLGGGFAIGDTVPAGTKVVAYRNPQRFQLIVPGQDGDYGTGGDPADLMLGNADADNITNFSNGLLMDLEN